MGEQRVEYAACRPYTRGRLDGAVGRRVYDTLLGGYGRVGGGGGGFIEMVVMV